ncbi:MAG: hypothetical protein AB7M05_09270 [Alphaproteobacteria bacterium]
MDFDLRLKALTRLSASLTVEAEAALEKELKKTSEALESSDSYELLENQIKILRVISHRVSAQAIKIAIDFIRRLRSLQLTYTSSDIYREEIAKYQNVEALTVQAIDVVIHLRYLETKTALLELLELSRSRSDEIRKKAFEGLESMASYEIDVMYGNEEQQGIGVVPQLEVVSEISTLSESALRESFSGVVVLLAGLLSPTMKKISSTYQTVTFAQGRVPGARPLLNIRSKSIRLLKRLYPLAESVAQKLEVIGALREATRSHHSGENQEDADRMIERDTVAVLSFFGELISDEDFSIIQRVEHDSYWIFYHANGKKVERAAADIEKKINSHAEYKIYKTLIGFEGIFSDWQSLKTEERDFEEENKYRRNEAAKFASSITPQNYEIWFKRILKYAETRSDDLATFPIFYFFLERFASNQPRLALRLIADHVDAISPFIIPLLRSLSESSEKNSVNKLILAWAEEGRFLYASIKQFLSNENFDPDLLDILLKKVIDRKDVSCIALVMSVVVSNYRQGRDALIGRFFLPALGALTQYGNADWVNDFWYRREARLMFRAIDGAAADLVLTNLLKLKKIDYHSEEILFLLAEREPLKVFDFFCRRILLDASADKSGARDYEAIPYELHKLHRPLSEIPAEVVASARATYDGNYGMFIYRGARLVHIVFPEFSEKLENELLKALRSGEAADIEFVLAILRTYRGEVSTHRVSKEIIRLLPVDSILRKEVAIALDGTGVVSGAFGFADAYARKKDEIAYWLEEPDEKIRNFAKWQIETLEKMIVAERSRAEEDILLRKHRYGE